jgi:vang-like
LFLLLDKTFILRNLHLTYILCILGNTSETGFSVDEFRGKFGKETFEENIGIGCARYIGTVLAGVLSLLGFLSPVAMVVLPKLGILTP